MECGGKPSDWLSKPPAAYSSHKLSLIVSTHVDDLKGGGVQEEVNALIAVLEKEFGKGKLQWGSTGFEHCGVMHKQLPNKSLETHQNHYVKQLTRIDHPELRMERA